MRKLLLLNNILILLSIGKCASDRVANKETQPVQDTLSAIVDSSAIDSMGAWMAGDSIVPGADTIALSKADKYNSRPVIRKEAPKHNAPEQARIDSIKQAKGKGKQ